MLKDFVSQNLMQNTLNGDVLTQIVNLRFFFYLCRLMLVHHCYVRKLESGTWKVNTLLFHLRLWSNQDNFSRMCFLVSLADVTK